MKRKLAFWLMMTVISAVASMAIMEFAVRFILDDGMQYDLEMWKYAKDIKQGAVNPMIGHVHRPNSEAHLMGVDVKINSKGLRDREIAHERTPSTLRILMLGDSFTEGWGVPLEQTFSKRIERLYAVGGVKAEVINAGVGNYNTTMEVNYFLDEGRKYVPDIVVLNYVPNDAEPVPAPAKHDFWLRACHLCVFLFGRFDTLLRETSVRPDWQTYYLSLYADGHAKGWLDAKSSIATLCEYARSHQVKLLIAYLPELHDVGNDPLRRIAELVRQAADENGAEFLDVLPEIKQQDSTKLWVSPTDPHPNAFANELIAKALFRKLQTMH
jgi:lysophospholipase L1-like esterase